LARTQKQLENIEQDLESNPVAPPIWLRRGTPIDSEVYYKGKLFIVSGHRYTNDGWFVSADDAKGTIEIPPGSKRCVGMPIYEEREFEAPNINDKTKADNDVKNEINDYSRDKLKPDNERRGTSPLDTTFTPLSVVSATRESFLFFNISKCPLHKIRRLVVELLLEVLELRGLMFKLFLALMDFLGNTKDATTKMMVIPKTMMLVLFGIRVHSM
jgi:hypothetical protein